MQSDGSYPTSDSNHWVFVVLCQFLREIWYFFSGLVHKLRKCCCGPKVAPGPSTSCGRREKKLFFFFFFYCRSIFWRFRNL